MVTPPTCQVSSNGLPCGCDRLSTFFYAKKIDYNSVNLNRIPTKIGMEMCCNVPFTCMKFQRDRSMRSQVMIENTKCAKRRRKIKKTKLV